MVCGACAGYGHSSSYVHIDHLSHGLGSYDGGYDNYDDHDYHVSHLNYSNMKKKNYSELISKELISFLMDKIHWIDKKLEIF